MAAAFLLATALYGASLGGHLAAWQASASARAQAGLIAAGFGINEVIVKGRIHMARPRVDEALQLSKARTIFGFDTHAAKTRLEANGWVKSARVMRLWPSTLLVELEEREPFARWHIRGHTVLIDAGGALLGPVTPVFASLPQVAGEGAHQAAGTLFDVLDSHPDLSRQIVAAKRIEGRRWDLILKDGRRVQLPAQAPSKVLPTVRRLLAAELPDSVSVIDARVVGRIALRRETPHNGTPGPTAQLPERSREARPRPL